MNVILERIRALVLRDSQTETPKPQSDHPPAPVRKRNGHQQCPLCGESIVSVRSHLGTAEDDGCPETPIDIPRPTPADAGQQ